MPGDRSLEDQVDERYLRWQERALQQVGFLNNVLIGLGAGLVGLALARGATSNAAPSDQWKGPVIGTALLIITISVGLGLLVACVRLRSIRMTTSRNRVHYLWIQFDAQLATSRQGDLKRHYERWAKWSRVNPIGKNSRELRLSSTRFLGSLGLAMDKDFREQAYATSRAWERGLDDWTWRLLWAEFVFFGAGAVMLAIIPISQNL